MQETFRSVSPGWRLFGGPGAIERHLPETVARAGARRAFVVCSPSILARTDIVGRIEAALGERYAGVFDRIENDSTFASVQAARAAAEAAGADLLIAVGGGSVLVAVRAVAIFMGEDSDPFDLMTQYPEGGRPFSPRLNAPKPPIVNLPTTPTSAMNRAGTGLKNPDLDHRMEYFDPKTRPLAVVLDDGALLSAPPTVLRSTATTLYAGLIGAIALAPENPLVEGDVLQAFRLAARAYGRIVTAPDDAEVRRDLALAAFLQNRAEDDGRQMRSRSVFAGDYAVATALHIRYPAIGQGEATCAVQAHAIRLADTVPADEAERAASALGVWRAGMAPKEAADAVADALEATYREIGMPIGLRGLGVERDALPAIAAETVKNFNASAGLGRPDERVAQSLAVLEAAFAAGAGD